MTKTKANIRTPRRSARPMATRPRVVPARHQDKSSSRLRELPATSAVLSDRRLAGLLSELPRRLVKMVVRNYLSELREAIRAGGQIGFVWEELIGRLEAQRRSSLRRAINALGVVLHTGMGRAALSKCAQAALQEASEHFCNLAIDMATGRRGERYRHVSELLTELTGAEAAMVVNNNAAATLLILNTLAAHREAVISRGQLVEIGGAFRMPDIMQRSNVKMVEVGTTNRTHLKDYRVAVTSETGLIIRVHMSNYRIVGFTKEVPLAELVALGREFNLPVVDDLGSGALVDLAKYGLPHEPTVQESISAGADVVCFSGDKLLGGPQCGIIVGRKKYIEEMKKNPLTRAIRCGKLTYAALEATLRLFLDEKRLLKEHVVMRTLLKPIDEMERQAQDLLCRLSDLSAQARFHLRDGKSEIGSGSLATEQLPTRIITVKPAQISAEELARRLRTAEPPVFARIEKDEVLLDFRTIREDETAFVAQALRSSLCAGR